jgi:hypothetical protein
MNFFPNLQAYVKDDVNTTKIPLQGTNLPDVLPIGYYANKKVRGIPNIVLSNNIAESISENCDAGANVWMCKYTNIAFGTSGSTVTKGTDILGGTQEESEDNDITILNAFKNNSNYKYSTGLTRIDFSFLENTKNLLCQLPMLMIMLNYHKYVSRPSNYGYTSINSSTGYDIYVRNIELTSTNTKIPYPVIYLKKETADTANTTYNQEKFNACQNVMSRSRLYDVSNLLTSSLFFGIKDLFLKLKSIKILLSLILLITVYLLVQGTISSADIAFKIASLVSNRSYPSYTFIIGIILGIGIPALISIFLSRRQIQRTNVKFGKYDVTKSPYGIEVPKSKGQEKSDTALVAIMLGLAYTFIFIIYFMMRDKNNSPIIKICISAIFYILLTCIIFLLFYWAPIVSYANDEDQDRAFGISRPLKVWTKGDDNKDISTIISNKYIDRYLRRYFAIYAIVALCITIIYLAQSNTQQKGPVSSFIEGIMASCAIIALPILWIFNWYTGITLFIGYPMILMIARYFRYPLYYLLRQMYLNSPKLQSECTKLKQEFDHPESYTAPWDLMGITLFKYFIKFNCGRALYSDLFVDYRDGYRDISGNAYVTGHVFRMMMKDKNGPFDYYHHGLVFLITIIVFLFLIFGVVGKENAF